MGLLFIAALFILGKKDKAGHWRQKKMRCIFFNLGVMTGQACRNADIGRKCVAFSLT